MAWDTESRPSAIVLISIDTKPEKPTCRSAAALAACSATGAAKDCRWGSLAWKCTASVAYRWIIPAASSPLRCMPPVSKCNLMPIKSTAATSRIVSSIVVRKSAP